MQQVKVVNISNQSSSGPTIAWIANKQLSPGMSTVIFVSELPPQWETMGTLFSFEFLQEHPTVVKGLHQPLSHEDLKQALREVVAAELETIQSKPTNGLTKEDLFEFLAQLPVVSGSNGTKDALVKGPSASFVPDIASVDEASIEMSTSTQSGMSKNSLKERLKKAKSS